MVKQKGPGKAFRKGITLVEAVQTYGDDESAEAWFIQQRWPDGVRCPHCEGDRITERENRKPMPYHCRDCRKYFSVRTNTVLQCSNLSLSKWALAYFLFSTNLKGVSSMKLHRDLGIGQKAAWHLAHRIRESWNEQSERFAGPVEADETYIGGKESNKHEWKKQKAGRGTVGKAPVVGIKDRPTNQVITQVVEHTDKPTLQGFVVSHTEDDAQVYTDEASAYQGIPRHHEAVSHSAGEYVRGMAHTNGMESHWAIFERGIVGTYHHISTKHLQRYSNEFAGRHNHRPLDTRTQMAQMAQGAVGKRLRYADLVG